MRGSSPPTNTCRALLYTSCCEYLPCFVALGWMLSILWPLLTPRLAYESIIFLSLTLSVRLYVCHGQTSNRFFFFCFSMESSHFWPLVLLVALYKTLFFDFWFSLTPEIYSPEFGQKSPISWLVRQIHRRCLHLSGGLRVWPIQWNHAKCCGADPCCHGNEIWARGGV